MPKLLVFSIRDRALNAYSRPYFAATTGVAIRGFADEVNRVVPQNPAENPLNMHPEDYDLYVLGSWDDDSGEFDCGVPRQVAIGKEQVLRPSTK